MKPLNKKIILLSCILTAVVLFGSWFALQFFNTEQPIQEWVEDREGMEIVHLDIGKEVLHIEIRFENRKDFGQDYVQLENFLSKTVPGKQIDILISPEHGEYHPFWLEHAAPFLEWTHQEQYTQLADEIERLVQQGEIEDGHVLMNSTRIFVYLDVAEDEEVYVILPINKQEGGESR